MGVVSLWLAIKQANKTNRGRRAKATLPHELIIEWWQDFRKVTKGQ